EPFHAAMTRVAELVRALFANGHHIRFVDAGGGLGITYKTEDTPETDFETRSRNYAQALTSALQGLDVHLLLEPGRSIVAPAGALLTRVLYVKQNGQKRFLVVDAAMNDLIRPSLYSAYHEIVPVDCSTAPASARPAVFDVVGPICETGDFFARDREVPCTGAGDLVAILDAGAYGMTLSSNYNTRPRPAEVLVDGTAVRLVRKRETVKDLMRHET
ncbi:MAG: diaminopimelate decarboxylase, partial [Terriglobales bacterium]